MKAESIEKEALERGYRVVPMGVLNSNWRRLKLDKYRCFAVKLEVVSRFCDRAPPYGRLGFSRATLQAADTFLIHTVFLGFPEHLFVFPCPTAENLLGGAEQGRIYVPVEEYVSKTSRPRIDIWEYEDAWHLIPRK